MQMSISICSGQKGLHSSRKTRLETSLESGDCRGCFIVIRQVKFEKKCRKSRS